MQYQLIETPGIYVRVRDIIWSSITRQHYKVAAVTADHITVIWDERGQPSMADAVVTDTYEVLHEFNEDDIEAARNCGKAQ